MAEKLLVLGAQRNSLGESVANEAALRGMVVRTAGISGDEDDFLTGGYLMGYGDDRRYDHVVCTIGVNGSSMAESFKSNVETPLKYLDQWLIDRVNPDRTTAGSYVFISSNSAHIARTNSDAYCASKAALSMAVRVRAREIANDRGSYGPTYIYTYEPGWIEGTPMSEAVQARFGPDLQMHRIPGGHGLDKRGLAALIVCNLAHSRILHGSSLRVDLGDQ